LDEKTETANKHHQQWPENDALCQHGWLLFVTQKGRTASGREPRSARGRAADRDAERLCTAMQGKASSHPDGSYHCSRCLIVFATTSVHFILTLRLFIHSFTSPIHLPTRVFADRCFFCPTPAQPTPTIAFQTHSSRSTLSFHWSKREYYFRYVVNINQRPFHRGV